MITTLLKHLTLVKVTFDLVSKGMRHLPLDNLMSNLQNLIPRSLWQMIEPMGSGRPVLFLFFGMCI